MTINNKLYRVIFFFSSVLLLFLSFNYNFFRAVNPDKFYTFQSDSEALVIGRLVKSQNDGILSSEGRLGRYYGLSGDMNSNQTKKYQATLEGGKYGEYNSQIGFQGMVYSFMDEHLLEWGISPKYRIEIYHALNSLLFALVISIILLILYFDIGFESVLLIFLSILLSKWNVYFAKNMYWMVAFMFLPFMVVLLSCHLEEQGKKIYFFMVSVFAMIFVMLKSSMGYEYISTILISTVTPLVYYAVKNKWPKNLFIVRFSVLGVLSLLGFIFALYLHVNQLQVSAGSTEEGVAIIKERILARTQTTPESYLDTPYYDSQQASVFYVLYKFLLKEGSFRLKIPFLFWIILFAYISYKVYKEKAVLEIKSKDVLIYKSLIITTWFSFIGSLSWFVLAKSHSYIHNINYIVWHLPFMIYGVALTGYYWREKIKKLITKYIKDY